jgi:hypothetical protein
MDSLLVLISDYLKTNTLALEELCGCVRNKITAVGNSVVCLLRLGKNVDGAETIFAGRECNEQGHR